MTESRRSPLVRILTVMRIAGVAAGLSVVLPGAAAACLACIAMPTESLADKAAGAEVVALLRPDPADPFRFVPVGYLRGDGVETPVPFLVSRARAAEFAAAPSSFIVATWSAGVGWAIHDLGTPDLAATLQDLLSRDLTTAEARRDAFGPLVGHADPAIARMAMVEMATLPYAVFRESDARIDRRWVARAVGDPLWSEWVPVGILLLGLSDDPTDRDFIRRAAELSAEGGRTAHLAAWATAWLEAGGAEALDWLTAAYVDTPDRTDVELDQIGLALASHAGRDDAMGASIREVAARLAAAHPSVAARLVTAMMDRRDWSLASDAALWLDDGRIVEPDAVFVITSYVLAAARAEQEYLP
jgi:hypothetical protein